MILANLYFDPVAISQGMTFLLFCIPVVLLCEYGVYRVLCSGQGVLRATLTVLYANALSGIAGIFIVQTLTDISIDFSRALGYSDSGLIYEIALFILLLICTWLIEAAALFPLRKKLRMSNIFIGVGMANIASYAAIAIMQIVYSMATVE